MARLAAWAGVVGMMAAAGVAWGQGAPGGAGGGASSGGAAGRTGTGDGPKAGAAAARKDARSETAQKVDSLLKQMGDGGDLTEAERELAALFADLARTVALDRAGVGDLTEAAWALRLTRLVKGAEEVQRRSALEFLLANRALARELTMLVQRQDAAGRVVGVLESLRGVHGGRVAEYPALTAAMCVVHDEPRIAAATRDAEEPSRIDPAALMAYFLGNESKMLFGLGSLPPELMVYLVDTTATVEELRWALSKHAGDRYVGKRYFDLTYDTAQLKFNKAPKISGMPYTLENLRKVGGICGDQSYFAMNVARAIGVPATTISGTDSEMAHAWVGFLQSRGSLVWNTDEGRDGDYDKLEGTTTDPQTGRVIRDQRLRMSAELAGMPAETRHGAVALIDAAELMRRSSGDGEENGERVLALLEAAAALAPGSPAVWECVARSARGGVMTQRSRQAWFEKVMARCWDRYPSFAYEVVKGMIEGVESTREQSAAWDWAYQKFQTKPDLATDAKISQGRMLLKAGEDAQAYECYQRVIRDYPNDGQGVVTAVRLADEMLAEAGKTEAAVEMCKDAWRRIGRPSSNSSGVFRSSSFYRVGVIYQRALERMGRDKEAESVARQLSRGVDKEK